MRQPRERICAKTTHSRIAQTNGGSPARLGLAEADDAALVVAAQRGGGEAFEILVHRHRARLPRVALRFTRNEADAEDIVQQSFEKAFLHLQQFEGHSSFSTWSTRIAINEALMWVRKRSFRVEIPLEQSSADNGATQPLDFPDSTRIQKIDARRWQFKDRLEGGQNKWK